MFNLPKVIKELELQVTILKKQNDDLQSELLRLDELHKQNDELMAHINTISEAADNLINANFFKPSCISFEKVMQKTPAQSLHDIKSKVIKDACNYGREKMLNRDCFDILMRDAIDIVESYTQLLSKGDKNDER